MNKLESTRPFLGLQLYSVNAELAASANTTLEAVADIGYSAVEIASLTGAMNATQLCSALDRVGMSCLSAHVMLPQLLGDLQSVIDDAQTLGAGYVVVATPWVEDGSRIEQAMQCDSFERGFANLMNTLTLADWQWNAEQLNLAGEILNTAGIQLAYHNHGFEFKHIDGKLIYDELLAMTDPELVAMELDCGWAVNAGYNPLHYLEHYSSRIELLHLKDLKRAQPDASALALDGVHLGGGIIDWPAVLVAAANAGVTAFFVEQEPPFPAPVFEELKASYDYITPFFPRGNSST